MVDDSRDAISQPVGPLREDVIGVGAAFAT